MFGNIKSRQCYTARVSSGFLAVFPYTRVKFKRNIPLKEGEMTLMAAD